MRKLATIQRIADVQPIEGADAIEKVKINEWWCVAKRGEFEKNDVCVYFEIDSLLPLDNQAFAFLAKGNKPKKVNYDGVEYTGYRLKTIKLRGQLSQGLALPLSTFDLRKLLIPDEQCTCFNAPPCSYCTFETTLENEIGRDISYELGIVKYEQPIPAQLTGKMKGLRPGFLMKTDEERVQNIGDLLKLKVGTKMYVTEKLDGCSATFYKRNSEFGVCSRNIELLDSSENTLWNLARQYDICSKLPEGIAIQGEAIGEGIQGNPLKIQGHDLYVFNVFDINSQKFYNFEEVEKFCKEHDLKMVPVLHREYLLPDNAEILLKEAEGNSVLSPLTKREGIVLRPNIEEIVVMNGILSRFSFKAISNEYLLTHEQ